MHRQVDLCHGLSRSSALGASNAGHRFGASSPTLEYLEAFHCAPIDALALPMQNSSSRSHPVPHHHVHSTSAAESPRTCVAFQQNWPEHVCMRRSFCFWPSLPLNFTGTLHIVYLATGIIHDLCLKSGVPGTTCTFSASYNPRSPGSTSAQVPGLRTPALANSKAGWESGACRRLSDQVGRFFLLRFVSYLE